ncbi:effector-associated constant component EACC1 [Streptomyces griseoincarnatus]
MEITVQCNSDEAEGELRSLTQWLSADLSVRRHVQAVPGTAGPAVPGQQGDVIDIISLLISSGLSAAALGMSIASWRATRPQVPTLIVERPDGLKVEITGHSSTEVEEIIRRVLAP